MLYANAVMNNEDTFLVGGSSRSWQGEFPPKTLVK
jgi:hypothetical protein